MSIVIDPSVHKSMPHIRFQGRPGEEGTMFIADPSGNALEFKGFRDLDQLFVSQ